MWICCAAEVRYYMPNTHSSIAFTKPHSRKSRHYFVILDSMLSCIESVNCYDYRE